MPNPAKTLNHFAHDISYGIELLLIPALTAIDFSKSNLPILIFLELRRSGKRITECVIEQKQHYENFGHQELNVMLTEANLVLGTSVHGGEHATLNGWMRQLASMAAGAQRSGDES